MKKYCFCMFLVLGVTSCYALDDASKKTEKARQGLQNLSTLLNEVDAAITQSRVEYSDSLTSLRQRCEQLEREASVNSRVGSVVSFPSFYMGQIKEFQHKSSYYGSSTKTLHLCLDRQIYSQSAQLDDVMESNENYFHRFGNLAQENERLRQELQTQTVTHPQASQATAFSPFQSGVSFGFGQIKEAKYKKGYLSSSQTVHLLLERQFYSRDPLIDDFVESNENYFKRISDLHQENERLLREVDSLMQDRRKSALLEQENMRLNQTIASQAEDKRREILDLNSNISRLTSTINQHEQSSGSLNRKIQNLEVSLSTSNDEKERIRKENSSYLAQIKKFEEEKKTMIGERDQAKMESITFQTSSKLQQKTIDELQTKISAGVRYVEDLKGQLDRQAKDYEVKIAELKRSNDERVRKVHEESLAMTDRIISQGKEKLERIENNHSLALENFERYKDDVRSVLRTSGLSDSLLMQIDSKYGKK